MTKFHFEFAVENTTVDVDQMRVYLYNVDLPNLMYAIDRGADEEIVMTMNHADFFDARLRQYIAGFRKTLHQVLEEMQDFVAHNPLLAPDVIRQIIRRLRGDFLKNEWYELIPRLDKASQRIERHLKRLA